MSLKSSRSGLISDASSSHTRLHQEEQSEEDEELDGDFDEQEDISNQVLYFYDVSSLTVSVMLIFLFLMTLGR